VPEREELLGQPLVALGRPLLLGRATMATLMGLRLSALGFAACCAG